MKTPLFEGAVVATALGGTVLLPDDLARVTKRVEAAEEALLAVAEMFDDTYDGAPDAFHGHMVEPMQKVDAALRLAGHERPWQKNERKLRYVSAVLRDAVRVLKELGIPE